jgi:hypothetical protein
MKVAAMVDGCTLTLQSAWPQSPVMPRTKQTAKQSVESLPTRCSSIAAQAAYVTRWDKRAAAVWASRFALMGIFLCCVSWGGKVACVPCVYLQGWCGCRTHSCLLVATAEQDQADRYRTSCYARGACLVGSCAKFFRLPAATAGVAVLTVGMQPRLDGWYAAVQCAQSM